MLPDEDGILRLLAAVVKQWLKDARQDSHERAEVAAWLGLTPAQLQQRIEGETPRLARASSFYRLCPSCGRALPEYNASERGTGRLRVYCDSSCRARATKLRAKEKNHAAI
jgi:hypothetical protein